MPDWLNILIRSLVSIVFVFILTKLIGKRQLSQMTFFEYTVGIALGDLAAMIADDLSGPMYKGILAMSVYAGFPILLGWLALKNKSVRNFVEGKATILIKDGKVMEDNLKKERMSSDELLEHLRLKNAFRVADVEFALMEPNGKVSVLMKSQNQPITPKHLGVTVAPETEPQTVIMDGKILDESLATRGFNRGWLNTELNKAGVLLENVFIGQVDTNGQLFLDLFDDLIQVPQPQTLKLTYLTLQKCQADLEIFALSVQDAAAKKRYEQEAARLKQVLDDVTPLLTR
ncbi:DUF421 domain-containing protein [Tumebacillus lipolyticus]|uniref:DUF421 domain-containing protein n=1 Tax=Tumebacillus lipolyticus TaxID=1280370 RepID=A0ABW4ZYC9_9BACL